MSMLRAFLALFTFFLVFTGMAFAGERVTLRARVEATGAAITLGDVFENAGAVADRPIAPAPAAGQVSRLSIAFLQTAASSAGLEWQAPNGLTDVQIVHPAGARATLPPDAGAPAPTRASATATSFTPGDIVVRRGETLSLSYNAPGVTIATRARAMEDGALGQTIRVTNAQSNRMVDAIIIGPGAARAAQ